MRTRKTDREDIPVLKALWKEAFGDEQQDIDLFFETVYPNAAGFCAEDGGALVSMLFALPQTMVREEKQRRCAYLYAVATKKDRQGEGLCSALLSYAEKELRKRYFEALLLSPASEDLADFYAERGFVRQTGAKKVILDCAQPTGQATEIGVQDYAGLRETALWDIPHVRYDKLSASCCPEQKGSARWRKSAARENTRLFRRFTQTMARHGACSSGWSSPTRTLNRFTWAFPWNKGKPNQRNREESIDVRRRHYHIE